MWDSLDALPALENWQRAVCGLLVGDLGWGGGTAGVSEWAGVGGSQ